MEYFNKEKVDELFPFATMIPPMLINKFPGTRGKTMQDVYNSGEYFAQIKKDGAFYAYNKTINGNNYLFGRAKSKNTGLLTEKGANVPHIINFLNDLLKDKSCLILGEIYYPNKASKDVTKIMGCLKDKAIERQKDNYIHYYIYDIIMYDDNLLINVSAIKRYEILKEIFNNIELPSFIEIADIFTEDLEKIALESLSKGEEGIVLKKKDGLYYPGLRPAWETIKVKQYFTVDLVCTGFCEATKEYTGKELNTWKYWEMLGGEFYYGRYLDDDGYATIKTPMKPITKGYFNKWCTAIKIGAYNKNGEIVDLGTVASGLDDFLREDFAKNPQKYINKTVEIGGMGTEEDAIRHGRLIRFREDKMPTECKYEEIFK